MESIKFSLVVPVYNVEKYINKCLDSIINQSYQNFEVIIVNDGSKDKSQTIIDKYVKKDKRFKSFIKENGGLSSARNYGVGHITGDYLLFIDSDDYIDNNLLLKLNDTLSRKKVDIVRYNFIVCDDKGNIIRKPDDIEYVAAKIDDIIVDLIRRDFVEPACLYCYRISFWQKYKFKYQEGKIHEDFGLTPLVIYRASSITSINYGGYYYVQRSGSITKTRNYSKLKKAAFDFIEQYENAINILEKEKTSRRKKALMTYMSECVIYKSKGLDKKDHEEYINKLKELKVYKKIYALNFKKLIKKMLISINIKLYINVLNLMRED